MRVISINSVQKQVSDVTFNDTGGNWSEYLLDSYLWSDHSGNEVVEDNNL